MTATACPNCGEPLRPRAAGEAPAFCPACGQETQVKAPTLAEFAQQFGGAYLSTEGALWRTLKLLLLKPGELTRQYLAGRRKHYVLPLRLYLTISLLVLLAVRVAGDGSVSVNFDASDDKGLRDAKLEMLGGRAGRRDGVFFCHDLPDWTCARLKRRLDLDPKALVGQFDQLKERFLSNIGAAMFLLLPAFALGLKLAYGNRRLRYTEHLVFALHVHAFWFLALALTLADTPWLALPALIAVPVYTFVAMGRVYGGRRWPRLLRAGVVSLLYLAAMVVALLGLAMWTLLA